MALGFGVGVRDGTAIKTGPWATKASPHDTLVPCGNMVVRGIYVV